MKPLKVRPDAWQKYRVKTNGFPTLFKMYVIAIPVGLKQITEQKITETAIRSAGLRGVGYERLGSNENEIHITLANGGSIRIQRIEDD